MREAVRKLVAMGQLPDEDTATQREIDQRVPLLDEIGLVPPTLDETISPLDVFLSNDAECFGLSWTLLDIVESGLDWPIWAVLGTRSGWWIDLLRLRLRNAGLAQPHSG